MEIKTFEQMQEFFDKNIPCKKSIDVGDIIFLLSEGSSISEVEFSYNYAKILDIKRDPSKKDEWWIISLVYIMPFPSAENYLIVRTEQLNGELFTINGKRKIIRAPNFEEFRNKIRTGHEKLVDSEGQTKKGKPNEEGAKVIKLEDIKNFRRD